ncbi:MAG: dihydropyrimidinase [Anaerolineales bacterium]|nr:dihydropyrimidinase [Anaerolineales bacterium]
MFDTVIANGEIITASAVCRGDVGIVGEKIVSVGNDLKGDNILDATGCYVIPGGVDAHVHLQMPVGKFCSADTFASGTKAAALGGTTSFIDFVEPKELESQMDALEKRKAEADPDVVIDYGLHMTIPAWYVDHALHEIPNIMKKGIYSFKIYQAYGPLCLDDVRLFKTLKALGENKALPILHSENGPVIDLLREQAIANGHIEPIWHAETRPASLEAEAVGRALEIAQLAGSSLYIAHVSCAESLRVLEERRFKGQSAFGETCPHYLYLTREKLTGLDAKNYICAPALRTKADNWALWNALENGAIQVVSSDHCPFLSTEKASEREFVNIPGGVPSLEARLALVYQAVCRGKLDLVRWIETCCTNPARLFKLPGKGTVAPNYDADLVIFDPKRKIVLGADTLHEQVDWSPYEDKMLEGWPRDVFSRGELIVRDGVFIGKRGRGRFIRAG